MIENVNLTIIVGNVAKVSDMRYTSVNSTPVVDIIVAATTHYNRESSSTAFVKCTFMGTAAERAVEKLSVSDLVYVQGCLVSDDIQLDNGKKTSGRLKLERTSFRLLAKGRRSRETDEQAQD